MCRSKSEPLTLATKPDDQLDDSAALQKAVDVVGQGGGGAILLDGGVYQLDRPVTVRHHGVVIRGQGQEKTRLIFRYDVPGEGIAFYGLKEKMKIGKNSRIALHCRPKRADAHANLRGR